MGLLALVTIAGVGGAYANSHKNVKFVGTTYHAVTNGIGGFSWTTVAPSTLTFTCTVKTDPYCTIVTNGSGYIPTANTAPDLNKVTFDPSVANHLYTLRP